MCTLHYTKYNATYLQAPKFDIYVYYCTNKPKSTEVLMAAGDSYFQATINFSLLFLVCLFVKCF